MQYTLTNQDKAIREQWLKVSLIRYLGTPVLIVFFLFLQHGSHALENLAEIADATAAHIISLLMLYYFAYKKYGIRWLTLELIIGTSKIVQGFFDVLKAPTDILGIIFLAIQTVIYVWWYSKSMKLRRINKMIKIHKNHLEDCQSVLKL